MIFGLIEISFGSYDGVCKGYEFDIYWGVEYFGCVKIIEIFLNYLVGELIDDLICGFIKEDDCVIIKFWG